MALRFSANLGMMWASLPLLDRISAAGAAGFKAIELHWPYETPAQTVKAACEQHQLRLLSVNTPVGDVSRGDSGLAAQPGREEAFRTAFTESLRWAIESQAGMIHVLPGMLPVDAKNHSQARDVFLKNLEWASDQAQAHDITLLLEALNPRDKPGYFYHYQSQSNEIRQAVGRDNIKLMFDVYHVGVTEGDILMKLEQYLPHIGHIQIASVPLRAEPDEGEVRYEAVFKRLEALDYGGWIGCEYKPRGDAAKGLQWVSSMGLTL
jgi:hydroxypyruvate isomerase